MNQTKKALTCPSSPCHGCPNDNRDIVASHDGSRVYYDKQRPRVEIEIEAWETSSGGPNPNYQWKKGGYEACFKSQ
jgi:hypothetical protein